MSQPKIEQLRDSLGSIFDDLDLRQRELERLQSRLEAWEKELQEREKQLDVEGVAIEVRRASADEAQTHLKTTLASLETHAHNASTLGGSILKGIDSHLKTHLAMDVQAAITAAIEAQILPLLSNFGTGNAGADPATSASNQAAIAQADEQLRAAQADRDRMVRELAEMEAMLLEAMEGNSIVDQLIPARHELLSELASAKAESLRLQAQILELEVKPKAKPTSNGIEERLLAQLQSEVLELRSELIAAVDAAEEARQHAAAEKQLREELELASAEIMVLRSAKEELEGQVCELQVSTAPHGHMPHLGNEGLSWEERKRLLLQQLNSELSDDSPESKSKRLEIQDIIETTQHEIAIRDREIAELRELIQQQSEAHDGMAIGAAAVASLIEGDELIQQEREKLREVQRSWEEKLRQAEIDLSMERAKLARERSQLEEKLKELEASHSHNEEKEATTCSKERRWLLRLGLKDEKS